MSTVVVPADFKLPIGIAAFGLAVTGLGNVGVGFPISIVGLLLAFQASRVSFEFDDVVGANHTGRRPWRLRNPTVYLCSVVVSGCCSLPCPILTSTHVYMHTCDVCACFIL